MSDDQHNTPQEPKYTGELRIGEKNIPVSADSLEMMIAKTHDALQGMARSAEIVNVHVEQSHDSTEHRKKLEESLRRRTGRPKVGGGAKYFNESQQFRTHPDGTVLMHGILHPQSASKNLTTRMHLMRALQTDASTPTVQGDLHFERVAQSATSDQCTREQFDALIQQYETLPLNEEIDDAAVRRLCAALGACGIQTEESCEGHGANLPQIWFTCPEDKLSILAAALHHLREKWEVQTQGLSHYVSPPSTLYVLSPKDVYCTASKAAERYPRAIQDLDTLGLTLLMQRKPSEKI